LKVSLNSVRGRQPRLDHQDRQAGKAERESHRHSRDQQRKKDAEQDRRGNAGRERDTGHCALP
jgi:hypothetical protein